MEKLIDAHCHLQDDKFLGCVDEVVMRAVASGVEKIITNGTTICDCEQCLSFCEQFESVFCTVGIHPEEVDNFDISDLNKISEMAKNKKVVAIGEIGLDYYWRKDNIEKQKQVFVEQLKLASTLGLPVVIHSRDATRDMVEILQQNAHLLKNGVLWHCFSESVETYKIVKKMGIYISVGGVLTFKNAGKIVDVARVCDRDKIMLETDSPYLAPEGKRGKRNEPANVGIVAAKLAELWDISQDEVANITTQNANKLFWSRK